MQNINPEVANNIDRIVESLNDEYFADDSIYDYVKWCIAEKKSANNPIMEMKSRIDCRLHALKQEGRGLLIRRTPSEERREIAAAASPILHVSPTPSSIGGMLSGLLGSSGSL